MYQRVSALFITGAALLIALSCKHTREGHIEKDMPVVINLSLDASLASLAAQVDSVCLIPLEVNDQSLISSASGIHKILYKENRFFILDDKYMAIKVFDTSGKYLYNVGKLGVGKGEFTRLEDMEYDTYHQSIQVLCNQPRKLINYSLDGSLLKDAGLDFWATSFAISTAGSRLFYVNQNVSKVSGNKNMLWADTNGIVKSRSFDLPKYISSTIKFSGGLYSTGGSVFFNPALSDTYYLMLNDTAKPVWKINHGAKNIPPDIRQEVLLKDLARYSYQCPTFVKYGQYIGFNYMNGRRSTAFYHTGSGKTMVSDVRADSLNLLFSHSLFECDSKLIMVADLNKLASYLQRNEQLVENRFPGLFRNVTIKASYKNPALLIFTLKER